MIENMTTELTMLGTGNATVTKCYNTCFTIKTGKNILLVDAGGGNGILGQLEKAGIAISEIHDMFVTHAHTDHILGAVWMVRIVMQKMLSGQYTGTFRVYGHDKVLEVLDWICRKLLPAKIVALIGSAVEFREVKERPLKPEVYACNVSISHPPKKNSSDFERSCRTDSRLSVWETNLIM